MYILVFDLPREKRYLRVKVNRILKKNKAKLIQHSVWASDKLKVLSEVALLIRQNNGKAEIYKAKKIF